MTIKRVCDRCGNVSNGHKIYIGRFLAFDKVITSQQVAFHHRKKDLCSTCYQALEKWIHNK